MKQRYIYIALVHCKGAFVENSMVFFEKTLLNKLILKLNIANSSPLTAIAPLSAQYSLVLWTVHVFLLLYFSLETIQSNEGLLFCDIRPRKFLF